MASVIVSGYQRDDPSSESQDDEGGDHQSRDRRNYPKVTGEVYELGHRTSAFSRICSWLTDLTHAGNCLSDPPADTSA